jgi:hypothetical protein
MSPLDDLTYDVITVLHSKAKALEAYDKYVNDAEADDDDELRDLFDAMRRQDEANVEQLKEVLAQRLAEDLGYDEEDEEEDFEDEEDEAELAEVGDIEERSADEGVEGVHGGNDGGTSRRGEPTNRQR